MLIQQIQKQHFSKELAMLRQRRVHNPNGSQELHSPKSPISKMHPFIDEQGLMRAGGRRGNPIDISYDSKYPKILPKNNNHVAALIRQEHETLGHAGLNQVFSSLGRRYWLESGRESVLKILRKCVKCQMNFKPTASQRMADLPAERMEPSGPFAKSGIDVFGPFDIKHGGRGTNKRYGLLITCYSSRSVHIEVLKDLSTGSVIQALLRFHSRRPGCKSIQSDNGTNFRSANKELRRAVAAWNSAEVSDALMLHGIQWSFNPARAPHTGGLWERMVKMTKRHLTNIMGHTVLDLETFTTVLVGVEGIINRRPLCYASSDIRDHSVLTPADFLYPGVCFHSSVNILPPAPPGGDNLRYSWATARSRIDEFWKIWSQENVTMLQARRKWQGTKPNLYVGQIVLMEDQQLARDQWSMAKVHKILSEGEHVRTVVVRTALGKEYERNIQHLVPLELEA